MKKQIKQLNKAYKKSFKTINKSFFKSNAIGLLSFVEYLRYLRDLAILTTKEELQSGEAAGARLNSLITAIAEFEACAESDKKAFHWNSFWELVKQNMEDWLELDDSI